VGVEHIASEVTHGDIIILEGGTGTVIANPDEATLKRYQAMGRNFQVTGERLSRELHDLPAVTKDGTRVTIHANIEMPDEIPSALEHGAEGIGLYRTEFLYLTHDLAPTEKDHIEAYRRAISLLERWKWNTHRLHEAQWTVSDELPEPGSTEQYRHFLFGLPDAVPVSGDFNGDGQAEFGVYFHGEWFIDVNSNGQWDQSDLWAQLGGPVERHHPRQ
jgi:hypothetical protein